MLLFVVLTLFATSTFGAPNEGRIIGGEIAENGAFPYTVSLHLDDYHEHTCGGSILSPYWILTAAHCAYGRQNGIVFVGAQINATEENYYSTTELIYHEDYRPGSFQHDIAVIRLYEPIVFNDNVGPIEIADRNTDGGVECVFTGWGQTSNPGSISNDLYYIELETITQFDCQDYITPDPVYDTQICTFTKEGEGACKGDSGGPLVANGKQIGILSFGYDCAIGYPDVFTRVYTYRDWIQKHTGL